LEKGTAQDAQKAHFLWWELQHWTSASFQK
jgi:hypothetical protein